MSNIPIRDIPGSIADATPSDMLAIDTGTQMRKTTVKNVVDAGAPLASETEATSGIDNDKRMSALRTKQSIASEVGVSLASKAQGDLASSAVQSVNGKSGPSVTLVKADVGLSNVDNTSDANKPISTATQSALNLKANTEDLGDLSTKSTVNDSDWLGLDLSVANGGTGASTADVARTNLGAASAAQAVPPGGNTGQVLSKLSNADNAVGWSDPYGGQLPDGSVTNAKASPYDVDPINSNRLKFVASTSSGAISAAVNRPVSLKLSEILHAKDFGVVADGVTNDTNAMVAAFAAMEATKSPLMLPSGVIMVDPDRLFVGNGAEGAGSSRNGQMIFGGGNSPSSSGGTKIRARSAGTLLFEVRGILDGMFLSGIHFDCAGLSVNGIDMYSMNESVWDRFSITGFSGYGLRQLCRQNPSGSIGWSAGNKFSQFLIASNNVGAYGCGIRVDGTPLNNYDPHRNTWDTGVVQVNKNAGGMTAALELAFADSNTFIEIDFLSVGSGLGVGVHLNSLTRTAFPQNNFMYGCSVNSWYVTEDASHKSGRNMVVNMPTQDNEALPTHPAIIGFTDEMEFLSSPVIDKDFGDVIWKNRAGSVWWRIRNNSGSGGDDSMMIERSINGTAWTAMFKIFSDGRPALYVPGIGLRNVAFGAENSAGAGFRSLSVVN